MTKQPGHDTTILLRVRPIHICHWGHPSDPPSRHASCFMGVIEWLFQSIDLAGCIYIRRCIVNGQRCRQDLASERTTPVLRAAYGLLCYGSLWEDEPERRLRSLEGCCEALLAPRGNLHAEMHIPDSTAVELVPASSCHPGISLEVSWLFLGRQSQRLRWNQTDT